MHRYQDTMNNDITTKLGGIEIDYSLVRLELSRVSKFKFIELKMKYLCIDRIEK